MRIRSLLPCLILLALALGGAGPVQAAPRVVASVKPLHSLVAGVMAGVGEPKLIVPGGASPHTYALKPSDAQALQQAEAVFWFGPELETFLAKPLETLGQGAVVELLRDPALGRPAGEEDAQGGHDHDHDHGEDGFDPHVWLDPMKARHIVEVAAARLAELDAPNAARYAANAAELTARIEALDRDLTATLAPVRDRPFVVFHDAYRHLVERYGLASVGALTLSPDRQPSARHLAEIRESLRERGVACIFAEPQFESRLIDTVIEGSAVRTGTLDPEGASIPEGPDLYFDLMRFNGRSLADCLAG